MKKEAVISIIITTYNREKYIKRCIDSVLGQKNVKTEIIIVDDGSTDSTPDIIDKYAKDNQNIKVIHQKNSGLSVARNVGLDNVGGDFIAFVDDDDFLPDNALEILLKLQQETDADFVMGNYSTYDDDGKYSDTFIIPEKYCNKLLSKREVCELLLFSELTHVLIVSWGKLYKRGVWDDIRFPAEIIKSEDQFIFPELMHACEKIYFTDAIVYNQVMSSISISRNAFTRNNLYHAEGISIIIGYLLEMQYYDIVMFMFGEGTRALIYFKKALKDETCQKEIRRLIKIYKSVARKVIPFVEMKNKLRLILFAVNFGLYSAFQRINARIYRFKHSFIEETK